MGMLDRALALISAECTCRRMETKWEESFSPASGERRGAQRLKDIINTVRETEGRGIAYDLQ